MISRAFWEIFRRQKNPEAEFSAELETTIRGAKFLNYQHYTSGDAVLVDEIIDYPFLWQRLAELGAGWGGVLPPDIPRAKSAHRLDRRPATEILSDKQKERIWQLSRREFEIMGYAR